MNDPAKIRAALDLGLQAWRTTSAREKFLAASDALNRMEDQNCALLAERELGPQPYACPNAACPVLTLGAGYSTCPRCGGELRMIEG